MKNYFIILSDRIELMYQGRMFSFDLNDGDREDYWNSFTYNGKDLDINYFPVLDSLTIYSVHDDTGQIDTSQFETAEFIGDLTGKCVIIDANNNELNRYSDSKEIIVYDDAYSAVVAAKSPSQFYIIVSNILAPKLSEIFTQKIDQYEKSESRRGA